jgi:hypothetical protein
VRVTAENGATKDYTITVTKTGSSNANLGSLSISPGSLDQLFSSSTTAYTAAVANGVNQITVNAGTSQAGAITALKIGGSPTSNLITLPVVGLNTITVTVTAENGTTTKTYTIGVTRAGVNNSNPQLAGITINGSPVPGFSPSNSGPYDIRVPNATGSITVAWVKEENATGVALSNPNPVPLTAGIQETITLTCTAWDLTSKTYTLEVTRNTSNSISVTITRANEEISLISSPTNDLSREAYDTLVVTAPSGCDSYDWTVDGYSYGGISLGLGGREATVYVYGLEIGSHSLRLEFYKDSVPYGSEVIFKVVR